MGRKAIEEQPSSYTPEYYKQYYHAKNETLTCEICQKPVKKFGMYVHKKGKIHLFNEKILQLNSLLEEKKKNELPLGENINII
jgi:hypothetical protein